MIPPFPKEKQNQTEETNKIFLGHIFRARCSFLWENSHIPYTEILSLNFQSFN